MRIALQLAVLAVLGAAAACNGDRDGRARGGAASGGVAGSAGSAGSAVAAEGDAAVAAAPGGRGSDTYDDLPSALAAVIPADARVIGFGELHARTDRGGSVRSALDRFTHEGLPAIADRLSDLVIETWVQDPSCAKVASEATARVETTMRRPAETRSEIAELADAARKKGVQPRAMQITCADYARIAPPGKEVDAEAMLALTTRELTRVTSAALTARDGEAGHRPSIAVYGGALHNDRFPEPGTEEWSYAAAIDRATGGKLAEVDLVVPEYAVGDATSMRQPWYRLVEHADGRFHVWRRGERSAVIVLPRSAR